MNLHVGSPRLSLVLTALLSAFDRLSAQAPPLVRPAFHVDGVVLAQGKNVPVPRCHLSIRLEGERTDRRQFGGADGTITATTDTEGHFSFDLPSEGSWQLSASAAGFRTQFLNEHEGFSSAVVLHSGSTAPSLIFHLEPDSTVSGVVRDEAADPVRNAVLSLEPVRSAPGPGSRRFRATTDDRGHYEIAGIAPGTYKVSVQATPWYTSGPLGRSTGGPPQATPAGDPQFDVVYPLTWYPGVLDRDAGGDVSLRGGEDLQISFSLLPIPAAHLRLPAPASAGSVALSTPTIERIEHGQPSGISSPISAAAGQLDFGSLAPGLYRVNTPGSDGNGVSSFLHIAAGATVSLAAADTAGAADVIVHIDGDDPSAHPQIVLTDVTDGSVFTSFSGSAFGLRRRFQPDAKPTEDSPERHLTVPAGQYQVTLAGDPDLYLTTVTLKGAAIASRVVTLPGGPATLTLNVARGRASVIGHAVLVGKPVDGAMVMLVPTTFGQPGAIDLLRRDQSNTDGSFELADVIPGNYILFAIDRGWTVNWHDPATLNRYLVHGTPLSLQPRSKVQQEIPAQAP
jgi:hypothetical protein